MHRSIFAHDLMGSVLPIKSWPHVVLKPATPLPHTDQLKAWAAPETTALPPLIGSALGSIPDCKYQTCLILSTLSQAASGMDRSGAAANEKPRSRKHRWPGVA